MKKRTYQVWWPDMGATRDDAKDIEAPDAREAAGFFIERADRDEPMDDEQSTFVHVCCEGGPTMRVDITCRYSRNYFASEPELV